MMAHGYAVIEGGEILVRTVSPHRRAAIVNWLCVSRGALITDGTSDERIEQLWEKARGGAEVKQVRIELEAFHEPEL